MKKEVILVPKDKCPLDVLAEMGERTKNSWIFLHEFAYQTLNSSCDTIKFFESSRLDLIWYGSPETVCRIRCPKCGQWFLIDHIEADDIFFKEMSDDPEELFFIKMEE